ncbi:aryl-sulfate sulfotransferase [bacterium]|nr:aryl-sulfate sulfotransferase [bacterium]
MDDMGASANIWIDVLDWQNDVGSVYLYCPAITAEPLVPFTQVDNTLFQLELVNNTAAAAGEYPGVIIAYSSGVPLFDFVTIKVSVEQNTIGMIQNLPGSFEGYTLFSPGKNPGAYLIDMDGNLVHSWESDYIVGSSCYLLENGNLLYSCRGTGPGPIGGRIEEIDWDGNLIWEYDFPAGEYRFHHDIERLPNGNTLFVAFEFMEAQETLDAGRDPALLPTRDFRPDSVIEIKPYGSNSGNIVWEWHTWDHMSSVLGGTANGQPVSTDITDPGKLNINFPENDSDDWLHINAVDYNPEYDQIILSSRHLSEVLIIDHSTADYLHPQSGIDAARGPAGDILYRWGNPQAYGAGDESDQKYFGPHDAQWIEPGLNGEGNILVFNNGRFRGSDYSSIDEIVPPVDEFGNYELIPGESFGPAEQSWIYTTEIPEDFFSGALSGTQRLPNGNTLICEGNTGRFFEITPDEEIVWEYINPITADGPQKQGTIVKSKVFRCYRYSADYPALAGRDLTPGDPIELPRE